jgi:ABC-type spermidine/putrescine transport system permease subunit II
MCGDYFCHYGCCYNQYQSFCCDYDIWGIWWAYFVIAVSTIILALCIAVIIAFAVRRRRAMRERDLIINV